MAMVFGRAALRHVPLRPTMNYSSILPSWILRIPRDASPVARFQIRAVYSESKLKETAQPTEEQSKLKETAQPTDRQFSNTWKIKMLYDGECPLCMREVSMLRERNQAYGTINFVDISSDDYSPEENQGLNYKTLMGKIHAIQSDGTIFTDVEAFRRLYEEVGLGWVYALTKYKPILKIANGLYRIWAAYRLQLTGRPSLDKILDSKRKLTPGTCNDDKICKM
ncbi:uncharacterized protein At5g50100, mitochondrial isoform X2 [Phalaenopsis equestris]|uniref:uncharacterized protein At5g50100, mitochondrial isoform X2 n=1 Tax=Phalaenopsis equestris TaxID=78828 RepID=UPI0009E631D1|nr:uncharacterized protein At5g50100, mitochondrial isoform X2 [Phalaenopsis equestris]XP_020581160.1 uncharacterized protein At5g50100, mitochondrial isoform X2 [Phalaenopsis equestris]